MPWLLNFNGFREKLICRIKAQLSHGFLLSEHQTLGVQEESANEERDNSRGSACDPGSQTSGAERRNAMCRAPLPRAFYPKPCRSLT